ncbi:hypothetical protein AGMMS50239_10580 [Bacteroidia bacterium]|nr:hypothetical protein AGMMS50239_10580 [Bacteroidia bacterium]
MQVNHIQIKFDGAISISDAEALASQFVINMASNRTVEFAVNALDASILDITLTGAANVDTLQKKGYAFELIDGEDADNPYVKQ